MKELTFCNEPVTDRGGVEKVFHGKKKKSGLLNPLFF